MSWFRFYSGLVLIWLVFLFLWSFISSDELLHQHNMMEPKVPVSTTTSGISGGMGQVQVSIVYGNNINAILDHAVEQGVVTVKDQVSGDYFRVKGQDKMELAHDFDHKHYVPTPVPYTQKALKLDAKYSHLAIWWSYSTWSRLKHEITRRHGDTGEFSINIVDGRPSFALKKLSREGQPLKFSESIVSVSDI